MDKVLIGNQKIEHKNKIVFLEFLRVICMLTVVLDHVVIAAIHIFDKDSTAFDKFIYNGISYWSHFAVPIFLMISGYLLLDPNKEIGYDKALGKYAKRMVIVLAFFGTIFAWLEIFFNSGSFALVDIWNAIYNMLSGETWGHMWYFYTLIGIYLVLPVIKPIFQSLKIKEIDCFLCIMFLFSSILPMIDHLTGFSFGVKLPITTAFLFYFLVGRRVAMMNIDDMTKKVCPYIGLVILMVCPFVFAYMENMLGFDNLRLASYSSPLIILLSILIFIFFMSMNNKLTRIYEFKQWGGVIKHLSTYSFGIYITHMIWINVLYKVIRFNPIEHNILIIIPLTLVVFVISEITTFVCKKIPYIGKYI